MSKTPPSENQKTPTPHSFEDYFNRTDVPIIPVTISGNEYNLLIDTGSDSSYLDCSIIDKIEKKLKGQQKGIVGAINTPKVNIPVYEVEFNCGDFSFSDIFTINDFSVVFDSIRDASRGVQLHGILGSRFLARYKCILDFNEKVFYL